MPNLTEVTDATPAPGETFAELLDYCRKNPGKLSYGSTGTGTSPHLAVEEFAQKAGIKLNHLPGAIGAFFERLPAWVTGGLGVTFYFGGTSLLIIVVVTMDFMAQVQNYMMSQQYESLLKKASFKTTLG